MPKIENDHVSYTLVEVAGVLGRDAARLRGLDPGADVKIKVQWHLDMEFDTRVEITKAVVLVEEK